MSSTPLADPAVHRLRRPGDPSPVPPKASARGVLGDALMST
ncbi:MAG: hypothetical protein WBL35_14210 [Ornithinibacter sp.]